MTEPTALNTPSPIKTPADIPVWKLLADDAGAFAQAAEDLTHLLEWFDEESDVPEVVQEAAGEASFAVYGVAADVERRLRTFRAAVEVAS